VTIDQQCEVLESIAFALLEIGHPLESIRNYELPAAYAYLNLKVESVKKQKEQREKAQGKTRLSSSALKRKISRSRSKKRR
jgi:hypothetical protein